MEGSTQLVHRLGDRYRELINDVPAILTDTAVGTLGQVMETRADQFVAVFERPRSAVDAAVNDHPTRAPITVMGEDLKVRVRIGIHSGHPTLNEANYIGMDVHTHPRICSAAHGGQILVSGGTSAAAKRSTSDGLRFKSLGQYRLRGVPDAVPLFQVVAKGLDSRFPLPRIADNRSAIRSTHHLWPVEVRSSTHRTATVPAVRRTFVFLREVRYWDPDGGRLRLLGVAAGDGPRLRRIQTVPTAQPSFGLVALKRIWYSPTSRPTPVKPAASSRGRRVSGSTGTKTSST